MKKPPHIMLEISQVSTASGICQQEKYHCRHHVNCQWHLAFWTWLSLGYNKQHRLSEKWPNLQTVSDSSLFTCLLTYTCKCVENLLASCKVSNIYVLTFSSCQKCKCPSYYICNALALYLWLLFPEEVSSLDFVILAILLTHWPNYICNLAAFTSTI